MCRIHCRSGEGDHCLAPNLYLATLIQSKYHEAFYLIYEAFYLDLYEAFHLLRMLPQGGPPSSIAGSILASVNRYCCTAAGETGMGGKRCGWWKWGVGIGMGKCVLPLSPSLPPLSRPPSVCPSLPRSLCPSHKSAYRGSHQWPDSDPPAPAPQTHVLHVASISAAHLR